MDRSILKSQQPQRAEIGSKAARDEAHVVAVRRRFVAPRLERHAPLSVVIAGSFDLEWG